MSRMSQLVRPCWHKTKIGYQPTDQPSDIPRKSIWIESWIRERTLGRYMGYKWRRHKHAQTFLGPRAWLFEKLADISIRRGLCIGSAGFAGRVTRTRAQLPNHGYIYPRGRAPACNGACARARNMPFVPEPMTRKIFPLLRSSSSCCDKFVVVLFSRWVCWRHRCYCCCCCGWNPSNRLVSIYQ